MLIRNKNKTKTKPIDLCSYTTTIIIPERNVKAALLNGEGGDLSRHLNPNLLNLDLLQ